MDDYIIVTTLCNKKEIAENIQKVLLEKRLIAGCQISKRESSYWWNEKIEKSTEYHLEMRTKKYLFKSIEQEINKIHDYQVPEISCYSISNANTQFLNWIDKYTAK